MRKFLAIAFMFAALPAYANETIINICRDNGGSQAVCACMSDEMTGMTTPTQLKQLAGLMQSRAGMLSTSAIVSNYSAEFLILANEVISSSGEACDLIE